MSILILNIISYLFLTVNTYAAEKPQPPIFNKGCEGECCGSVKTKVAMRDFPLFEKPDVNSPKIHQMLKGHKFDTYENYTKTIKLGTGIVAVLPNWAKGKGLKRGDKVTVIRYIGEGWHSIWFNGEILSADLKEIKPPPKLKGGYRLRHFTERKAGPNSHHLIGTILAAKVNHPNSLPKYVSRGQIPAFSAPPSRL